MNEMQRSADRLGRKARDRQRRRVTIVVLWVLGLPVAAGLFVAWVRWVAIWSAGMAPIVEWMTQGGG